MWPCRAISRRSETLPDLLPEKDGRSQRHIVRSQVGSLAGSLKDCRSLRRVVARDRLAGWQQVYSLQYSAQSEMRLHSRQCCRNLSPPARRLRDPTLRNRSSYSAMARRNRSVVSTLHKDARRQTTSPAILPGPLNSAGVSARRHGRDPNCWSSARPLFPRGSPGPACHSCSA